MCVFQFLIVRTDVGSTAIAPMPLKRRGLRAVWTVHQFHRFERKVKQNKYVFVLGEVRFVVDECDVASIGLSRIRS